MTELLLGAFLLGRLDMARLQYRESGFCYRDIGLFSGETRLFCRGLGLFAEM